MFTTIQTVSTLAILVLVFIKLEKRGNKFKIGATCICLLMAILMNNILQLIPMPTEEIIIRALGEKNEDSKGTEVALQGFVLDGREYNKLEILEGKWFWAGESYMWRIESDFRQPEGTTQEITVAVPLGSHREVVFVSGENRGLAEIIMNDFSEVADLSIGKETNITIPDSDLLTLRIVKLIRLLGYLITLCSFSYLVIQGIERYSLNREKFQKLFHKNKFHLFIICLCLVQFLFFFKYAGVDGFWYDELAIIGFSIGDGTLFGELFSYNPPMPVVVLLERILYRIMPYGEKWLLLPYMLATVGGMYVTGLSGKRIRGKEVGIMSVVYMLFSVTITNQLAYEVRSYAFFFLGSAMVLYSYCKRLEQMGKETTKDILFMSLAMSFFSQMHYYAVVMCISYFLIDIVLFSYKKIKLRCCIPYIISASMYLPTIIYIVRAFSEGQTSVIVENSWQTTPTLSVVISLVKYLLGYNGILTFLFVVGFVCIFSIIYNGLNIDAVDHKTIQLTSLIWIPTFLISFMFFYGTKINPDATLWHSRYFTGLIPFLLIIASIGVEEISEIYRKDKGKNGLQIISMVLVFMILPSAYTITEKEVTQVRQPWREAADFLYSQENYIYNESTLTIGTAVDNVIRSWNEYYLTKQGIRDDINLMSQWSITRDNITEYERIYVSYNHTSFNNTKKSIIEEEFDLVENDTSVKVMTYERKTN